MVRAPNITPCDSKIRGHLAQPHVRRHGMLSMPIPRQHLLGFHIGCPAETANYINPNSEYFRGGGRQVAWRGLVLLHILSVSALCEATR